MGDARINPHVEGVEPEGRSLNLIWGIAHHEALGLFLRARARGEQATNEEVGQRFLDVMKAELAGPIPVMTADEGADVAFATSKGLEMVEAALDEGSLQQGRVVGVEHAFLVDLIDPDTGEVHDVRLKGVMDAVLEEEGHRTILELKTAARAYSSDEMRFDFQMACYSTAAEQLGWGPVDLRWHIVTKAKAKPRVIVEPTRRDERDQAIFQRTVIGTLKSIEAGVDFESRGFQCKTCAFRRRCESER
jgi:hypothetical protein